MSRRAIAARVYTLAALSERLGLPTRRWHRAREDALGASALFDRVVGEFGAVTPRELWDIRIGQREAIRVRANIAVTLAARHADQRPCTLVTRFRGRDPTRLRGVVEAWDAPHVQFAPDDGEAAH